MLDRTGRDQCIDAVKRCLCTQSVFSVFSHRMKKRVGADSQPQHLFYGERFSGSMNTVQRFLHKHGDKIIFIMLTYRLSKPLDGQVSHGAYWQSARRVRGRSGCLCRTAGHDLARESAGVLTSAVENSCRKEWLEQLYTQVADMRYRHPLFEKRLAWRFDGLSYT